MANFKDVKDVVVLTILAGRVPVIKGQHGLGKTDMMATIAKELGMKLITVEGGLLKEGEIGGLPIVKERKFKNNTGKEETTYVTEYAIHNKMRLMNQYLDDGEAVLLFIDELNRTDNAVMQELMNIILNREINGIVLPEGVYVCGAMNPSANDGVNNYSTNELDPAQLDRLTIIEMDADTSSWLDWALTKPGSIKSDEEVPQYKRLNKSLYKTNIDESIIEFLSMNADFLVKQSASSLVGVSPRSWEMASDLIRTYKLNSQYFRPAILQNALVGTISAEVYQKYAIFNENNKTKLVTGEEFLFSDKVKKNAETKKYRNDPELVKRFLAEPANRQSIMVKSTLNTLVEILNGNVRDKKDPNKTLKFNAKFKELYIELMEYLPADRVVEVMRYCKQEHNKMHQKLMDDEAYYKKFVTETQRIKKSTR